NFIINGNINFNPPATLADPNTHLVFEFDDTADNPTVIFKSVSNLLEIPNNTRIEFKGNGTVWFQDGMSIVLNGGATLNRAVFAVTDSAKMRLSATGLPPIVGPSTV